MPIAVHVGLVENAEQYVVKPTNRASVLNTTTKTTQAPESNPNGLYSRRAVNDQDNSLLFSTTSMSRSSISSLIELPLLRQFLPLVMLLFLGDRRSRVHNRKSLCLSPPLLVARRELHLTFGQFGSVTLLTQSLP